jgi:DNA mismatch repair protein MLH1
VLEAANNARNFTPGAATQQGLLQLPGAQPQRAAARYASQPAADADAVDALPPPASQREGGTQRERAGGDHKLVRTDARAGRLDAFLQRPASGGAPQLLLGRGRGRGDAAADGGASGSGAADEQRNVRARHDAADTRAGGGGGAAADDNAADDVAGLAIVSPVPCELTSVCELRAELAARAHDGLAEVFRRHTFVGMATGALALLQHGTKLYLASMPRLSRELFAQLALQRFGCAAPLLLSPPAPVEPLLLDALSAAEAAGEWTPGDGSQADVARLLAQLLAVKGPMLKEYFALDVGEDDAGGGGVVLRSLPLLCDGHTPDLVGLPEFLLRLGNDTDWEAEKPCFADVAKHLGELYAMRGPLPELQQPEAEAAEALGAAPHPRAAERSHEWAVAHVLLPALRQHFHPPSPFATDGTVLQVACLEQLYRVFERC